ncbi:hypothetical protein [Sphingomonas bacterium]|uniref:hypothetical protein n=1 Tax=Sphingomonas bacterium TaxID=1895847 RepID=UPI00261131D0|nr:hypothetical protein [Sphingomonas bacterium]
MGDHGLKNTLAFGHAVLDSVPKLDEYLWTYGPMIESQWTKIANVLGTITPPHRLIDYGCGQGLAGLLVNDLTDGCLLTDVAEVVLIEPSALALARAEAIYAKICPEAEITSVGKRFDGLVESDLPPADGQVTLHLFSNTLDVAGFQPLNLLEKTLQPGRNTIVSVSHDRDFNGGTPQIEMVKATLEHPNMASDLTVIRSELTRLTCDNPAKSKAVVWLCELEIADG